MSLAILDVAGRRKRTWALLGSSGSLTWDGTDDAGRKMSAGTYYAKLDADAFAVVRSLQLLR